MPDLAARIVSFVDKPTYRPLKPKALAKRLGVSGPEYSAFRSTLKELVGEGRLHYGKGHTIQPARPHGTVAGVFRKAAGGFGFVRPHSDEPLIGQDIYIAAGDVRDASSGDEVLVRITKRPKGPDRKPAGQIIKVVERATHQFVGTYVERGGEGFVLVDGTTFNEPIYVGDPGAKGARPDDKVVFEMVRFPSPSMRGEGVITEVLGPRGEPGVDTLSVIRAYGLPDTFPPDVLREAREQAAAFDENDLDGRTDFTQTTVITIDPVDARDFDDGVSLAFDRKKKHWHLAVHIADVAHFAPHGSRLDREARNRGTSVYLPQRVLPMFPEIISNNLASLQEGRLRYVQSALMEFTEHGEFVHAEFARGAIRVAKRFTYEQVSALLQQHTGENKAEDGDTTLKSAAKKTEDGQGRKGKKKPHGPPEVADKHATPTRPAVAPLDPSSLPPGVFDMLRQMHTFAMGLRKRRFKRGALELNMPEAELEFDDQGRVTGAHFVPHDVSHQIIEEFMLAANEAVARRLEQAGVTFLRRTHAAPDPLKLEAFIEFVRGLGYQANARTPADRFQLQRVLAESAEKPERYAVHYALLRSLKQAEYSPVEEGHYALASQSYCHFTSPIRRYPDLTVHRLLTQLLRTGRAGSDATELVSLGEHCSFTERRADRAEAELIKIKLLAYMETRIGMELDIIITGVEEYGFFGQAEKLPVEGLVHVSSLTDDYYHHDEATHSLTGTRTKRRFRLGDVVKVKVARVDVIRRQLDFRLADLPEPRARRDEGQRTHRRPAPSYGRRLRRGAEDEDE
jgi:ribonuclease R